MSSIEIRGIRLAYGEKLVLDDLDLTIGEGRSAGTWARGCRASTGVPPSGQVGVVPIPSAEPHGCGQA